MSVATVPGTPWQNGMFMETCKVPGAASGVTTVLLRALPERFHWIGRAGCVFFLKSFVVHSLRASSTNLSVARASLSPRLKKQSATPSLSSHLNRSGSEHPLGVRSGGRPGPVPIFADAVVFPVPGAVDPAVVLPIRTHAPEFEAAVLRASVVEGLAAHPIVW